MGRGCCLFALFPHPPGAPACFVEVGAGMSRSGPPQPRQGTLLSLKCRQQVDGQNKLRGAGALFTACSEAEAIELCFSVCQTSLCLVFNMAVCDCSSI